MKYMAGSLLLLAVLFPYTAGYGQNVRDTTRIYRIETKDGNSFTGYILSQDSSILTIKTERSGEFKIPLDEIQSKTEIYGVRIVKDRMYATNPQSEHYFWAPNGYGLRRGSSCYQNIWVLYNQVSLGVSNNLSLGAGILPLFLFAGAPTPFFVVPRISIPVVRDKLNIGTGAFLGTVLVEDPGGFGLLYETTTFGSRDKNVSLGFAYGFVQDKWMARPAINLSVMLRTGPKGYFITENYAIPYKKDYFDENGITEKEKYFAVISFGGRSLIRTVSLDYSLWIPVGSNIDTFVAIPFLGITVPFAGRDQ